MNRRNLLLRIGAGVVGTVAGLFGIRLKTARVQSSQSRVEFADFLTYKVPVAPDPTVGWKIAINNPHGEPIRFWLHDRFYVDLPEDRYTNAVCVDWAIAKERGDSYTASCRVCPDFGEPWEILPMKRIDG